MANSRESLIQEFVDWAAAQIKGDEKGEAQVFLDHLFRAFGQKGSLDVGGSAKTREPKLPATRRDLLRGTACPRTTRSLHC